MNIFDGYRKIIETVLDELLDSQSGVIRASSYSISIEPPRDPKHGDISTNAALVVAKRVGEKPKDLGQKISEKLLEYPEVEEAEVAGPGFVNLKIPASILQNQIGRIIQDGTSYGDNTLGSEKKINLEYVSANPTGPMHVGHARGAVIGDVLANLLKKVGFCVTREFYINDAGAQIDALAKSTYFRYLEACGETSPSIPKGFYPGNYLKEVGQDLADRYRDSYILANEQNWLPDFRNYSVDAMMKLIRADLNAIGIKHDVFTSEKAIHAGNFVEDTVEILKSKNLVYWGILDPPKGKKNVDWKKREQLLFRSKDYGDDVDRALKKSDQSWTYFAADIAYHLDKLRRGYEEMINIWGADHKGYIKRMQAAIKAVSNSKAKLEVKVCNLVNLYKNGTPFRMSKREGAFITLRELLDQVGPDIVRFMMLTRNNEAPLDFDMTLAVENSRENPVFYVQYAHARACSVIRNSKVVHPGISVDDSSLAGADTSLLKDEAEMALIRTLAGWPRLVEAAAIAREPHRLAFYLNDIASSFHALWNKGNENIQLRFIIQDDKHLTLSRLSLVRATAIVISSGLKVMGVKPVEEMR